MSAHGFRPGEAVRSCKTPGCRHVMVCRVGDSCPRCHRAFSDDAAAAALDSPGLPPGFILVGSWPAAGGAT